MDRRRVPYYLAGFVSVITLAVYLPALRGDFISWDDYEYVIDNPHIHSLDGTLLRWAFGSFLARTWHPLAWISHALDYTLWGLNPFGHHLTSIVLHALNTFLVVHLTVKLIEAGRTATNGPSELLDDREVLVAAGLAGMLFGLHPLHVEPVAWVSGRKDLLCALFFMLSVAAYVKHVNAADKVTDNRSALLLLRDRHYLSAIGFAVLASLSKTMAVTLPFVLLILDWYPFRRIQSPRTLWTAIVRKLPFITLSLIASAVVIMANSSDASEAGVVALSTRLLVAVSAPVMYLWKIFVPVNLVPYYPYPSHVSPVSAEYLVPIGFMIGATVFCVAAAKRQRLWLSIWGYYIVTLIPVLGIVQISGHSMADRYVYLPGIGPFLLAGLFMSRAWSKAGSLKESAAFARVSGGATVIALCISLSFLTLKQLAPWNNSMAFWSYIIEKEPYRVPHAYNYRGMEFRKRGQFASAFEDYNAAIALSPDFEETYVNRGIAFAETGQPGRAMEDFNRAIRLNPKHANAYISRGFTYEEAGRLGPAIEDFDKAITLNPFSADAFLDRGVAFERMGQLDRAIEDYGRAIEFNPYGYLAYCDRGIVLGKTGQVDRALKDFGKALSLEPGFIKAYLERGSLYLRTGSAGLAMRDYQKACNLGSDIGCEELRRLEES